MVVCMFWQSHWFHIIWYMLMLHFLISSFLLPFLFSSFLITNTSRILQLSIFMAQQFHLFFANFFTCVYFLLHLLLSTLFDLMHFLMDGCGKLNTYKNIKRCISTIYFNIQIYKTITLILDVHILIISRRFHGRR